MAPVSVQHPAWPFYTTSQTARRTKKLLRWFSFKMSERPPFQLQREVFLGQGHLLSINKFHHFVECRLLDLVFSHTQFPAMIPAVMAAPNLCDGFNGSVVDNGTNVSFFERYQDDYRRAYGRVKGLLSSKTHQLFETKRLQRSFGSSKSAPPTCHANCAAPVPSPA